METINKNFREFIDPGLLCKQPLEFVLMGKYECLEKTASLSSTLYIFKPVILLSVTESLNYILVFELS
jgi:hypothetical protein